MWVQLIYAHMFCFFFKMKLDKNTVLQFIYDAAYT